MGDIRDDLVEIAFHNKGIYACGNGEALMLLDIEEAFSLLADNEDKIEQLETDKDDLQDEKRELTNSITRLEVAVEEARDSDGLAEKLNLAEERLARIQDRYDSRHDEEKLREAEGDIIAVRRVMALR